MKRKTGSAFPEPNLAEIQSALPKSKTVQLRVTDAEKAEIKETANKLRLTMTEYLLKCHSVIEGKLRNAK